MPANRDGRPTVGEIRRDVEHTYGAHHMPPVVNALLDLLVAADKGSSWQCLFCLTVDKSHASDCPLARCRALIDTGGVEPRRDE